MIINVSDSGIANSVSNGAASAINNLNGIVFNGHSPSVMDISIRVPLAPITPPPSFHFDLIPHAISATGSQSLGSLSKPIAEGAVKIANLGFLLDTATRAGSLGPSALRGTFPGPDSTLFYDGSGSRLTPDVLDAGIWD